MRRYLLIALMFIPAIAAWVLFQGLDQKATKAIKRVEEAGIKSSKAAAAEALTGFEGRGTFYRHLSRVQLGKRELSYTSAFYLLDHWRRDEADIFWIDGLTVVRNPKPRSMADMDHLLNISNAEPSVQRLKRLQNARLDHNSLTAKKAKASGGKNVTDADTFELSQGVEANIPNKNPKLAPYVVRTIDAKIKLKDGDLDSLKMLSNFSITTPTYEITGVHLEGVSNESRLVIHKNPRIISTVTKGAQKETLRTLSCNGPLVWQPDDETPGQTRTILNRTRFDFGHLELYANVAIELPEITILADELKARVGHVDGKTHAGRLDSFRLRGHVVVDTPRGTIRGDTGRVALDPDGSAVIWVEGQKVIVDWNNLSQSKSKATKKSLHAESTGPLKISVPSKTDRNKLPLEIYMTNDVVLAIKDNKSPLDFTGESLFVSLRHVELESAEVGEARSAWRLQQAILRGHVRGHGDDFQVETTKLTVDREYEKSGALKLETLHLDGPAELQRSGGLGRNIHGESTRTTLSAKRRITYWLPASPFAEAAALAEGHVRAFETDAPDDNRKLGAEWLRIVLLPADGKKDRTKTLEAKGSVDFWDEKGSHILADRVWINRVAGFAEVEGAPARLTFVDDKGQSQKLRAKKIELRADDSKLIASGGFDGKLIFRGAVLASDKSSKKSGNKNNKEWAVSGQSMWALFGGRLPLSTKTSASKDPIQLLDIHLDNHVRIESDEQIMTGEHMQYDFRTDTGSMEGGPARLVSFREVNGAPLKDWVTAPKILTQPEWTLFEGKSHAHINIKRQQANKRPPSTWEILQVDCTKEILIRKDMAIFTGGCVLERGVVATGGLRLEAARAIAHFSPSKGKRPRPQKLLRIEADGNVQLARGSLRGQGEFLDFDYVKQSATLTSKLAPCHMWMDGGGLSVKGEIVEYDLTRKQIRMLKVSGKRTSKEGSKK